MAEHVNAASTLEREPASAATARRLSASWTFQIKCVAVPLLGLAGLLLTATTPSLQLFHWSGPSLLHLLGDVFLAICLCVMLLLRPRFVDLTDDGLSVSDFGEKKKTIVPLTDIVMIRRSAGQMSMVDVWLRGDAPAGTRLSFFPRSDTPDIVEELTVLVATARKEITRKTGRIGLRSSVPAAEIDASTSA